MAENLEKLNNPEEKTEEALKQEKSEELVEISKTEYELLLNAKTEAEKKLLYVAADFDNCKKRIYKDFDERSKFANEKILLDLLPVIDNLILALEHSKNTEKTNMDKFYSGITMIIDQFNSVLSKHGVEKVTALGEKFDPNYHEALDQRESDHHKAGEVIEEYQRGYTLNGKLFRCSKVCVCEDKNKK